jgi:hypothetical protein
MQSSPTVAKMGEADQLLTGAWGVKRTGSFGALVGEAGAYVTAGGLVQRLARTMEAETAVGR